jgi:hypothetical protein
MEVAQLKEIGADTIGVLSTLADALRKAQQNKSPPSEDPDVLGSLKSVMEQIKTFKTQVEVCKQANNAFVRTRQNPPEFIQVSYNELLGKIQSDLERIELENEVIKNHIRSLNTLSSSLNVDHILESARALALTSNAPPNWDQSSPLWPFRPPYPTEDLIRSSHLFAKMSTSVQSTTTGNTDEVVQHRIEPLIVQENREDLQTVHLTEEEEDHDLLLGLDIASL